MLFSYQFNAHARKGCGYLPFSASQKDTLSVLVSYARDVFVIEQTIEDI
jgi:hypothetical protein